jgi:hypothetical protein
VREHPDTEVLSSYLDSELPPTEAGRLQEHLRTCASCAERLGALRHTVARLRTLARPLPPAAIVEELRVRLPGARRAPAWRERLERLIRGGLVLQPAVTTGFALVVALTVIVYFYTHRAQPRRPTTLVVPPVEVREAPTGAAAPQPAPATPPVGASWSARPEAAPPPAPPRETTAKSADEAPPPAASGERRRAAEPARIVPPVEEREAPAGLAAPPPAARSAPTRDATAGAADEAPPPPAAAEERRRVLDPPPALAAARKPEPPLEQRVAERTFELRQEVWIERGLDPAAPVLRVAASSDIGRELLERFPELERLLRSGGVRLAMEGRVLEIERPGTGVP